MKDETRMHLVIATQRFYHDLCKLDDFPQPWLDGFTNVIIHDHTDHPDDNSYVPEEREAFRQYAAGAKAACSLLRENSVAEILKNLE
jgi:hypothetical protein